MKFIEKTFILEITEDDAKALSDALHTAYINLRSEYEQCGGEMAARKYQQMKSAREFRNVIAGLINRTYCGADA